MYKLILILSLINVLFTDLGGQDPEKVNPAFKEIFSRFSNVRDFSMSADSDEIFFTILSPTEEISAIAFVKKINSSWDKPEMISFSGNFRDLEPFLSPDGLKLYFSSDRPLADSSKLKKDFDIWYVKRDSPSDKWSEPINAGIPINTNYDEFYPSVSLTNNLYFTCERPGSKGRDDIFYSNWTGEKYSVPVSLSDSVNTDGYEFNAFIAPDESYIIFTGYNRTDGLGSGDLYLSFRKDENIWSQAINLGTTINSRQMDYCPFVELNTKTLYFTSKRSELKTRDFKSIDDFEKEINSYQNGFSRIYKISLEKIL